MDGIAKLFEQSNPLAWVIGAITMIALALVLRNNTLFSENKTFFIVVLAIVLVSAFYVASILLPHKVETKTETPVQPTTKPDGGKTEPPKPPKEADKKAASSTKQEPKEPKPINKTTEFLGTWKNRSSTSKRYQQLVFSLDGENTKVHITGYQNAEVGKFKTVFKAKNHLFIKQFDYLITNKYDNVDFKIDDNGILKMTYHVTLTDGYQENATDEFSKQ